LLAGSSNVYVLVSSETCVLLISLTGTHRCFWSVTCSEPDAESALSLAAASAFSLMKLAAFWVTTPRTHSATVSAGATGKRHYRTATRHTFQLLVRKFIMDARKFVARLLMHLASVTQNGSGSARMPV